MARQLAVKNDHNRLSDVCIGVLCLSLNCIVHFVSNNFFMLCNTSVCSFFLCVFLHLVYAPTASRAKCKASIWIHNPNITHKIIESGPKTAEKRKVNANIRNAGHNLSALKTSLKLTADTSQHHSTVEWLRKSEPVIVFNVAATSLQRDVWNCSWYVKNVL